MIESNPAMKVPTDMIGVVIRTTDQLIVGYLHASPKKRLKDQLNHNSERYSAITQARVYDPSRRQFLYEVKFLLLANEHIVTVTPQDALLPEPEPHWFLAPAPAAD
jgi:hypothetical protein